MRARHAVAAAMALTAAAFVGCYVEPLAPIAGHERDDINCADGLDNDGDYLIDCWDPDCLAESTLCGEIVPEVPVDEPEPNGIGRDAVATCRDRIDNDNDGQFDCGDQECRDIEETCCVIENTNELCSDGIDNDGNGFADCEDFGCGSRNEFVTVCVEDDCSDGEDNDGDGFTDCEDFDCDCPDGPPAPPEEGIQQCSDGLDNDDNGFTDCGDFGCSMSEDQQVVAYCTGGTNSESQCADGTDDDRDGDFDCDDDDCCGSTACGDCENTVEACSDNKDNDDNGFIDCQDRACSGSREPAVAILCQESVGGNSACSDGEDNDLDGFIDCEDWHCSHDPSVTVCDDEPKVCR